MSAAKTPRILKFLRKSPAQVAIAVALFTATRLKGEPIPVPNGSFEAPLSAYADPMIDRWEQNPPFTFQATGVFSNQAPTDPTYIHNMNGQQAAFIANAPTVEISLDYTSVDWTNRTHLFYSKYEVGRAYDLTVGVIGGGGGAPPGATLRLGLYYRDASSNKVVIAQYTVTNSLALFPDKTNFVDFKVHLGAVKATDAWAGKNIGIQLVDTSAAPSLGYWDVDNVRLDSTPNRSLVYVPNGSFELPLTAYADPMVDYWEQNPPYTFQATGVFSNQAPSDPTYIHNNDGKQAAFIANAPTVEISLDNTSVDWVGRTGQFPSKFEVNKAYDLTVGVIGGGGGAPPGATLRIGLYYRDPSSNKVVIAQYTVTNSLAVFSDKTNFVDFTAHLDGVKPTDAWAGKYIGIQIVDTSGAPSLGYWDVDNVRLRESITVPNGSFELPLTAYADPMVDYWEQNPPYTFQATGVFSNQAASDPTYIHNIEGQQAAFIANAPTVGISLDYTSVDWTNRTQQFQSRYEVGKAYDLSVGVIGGGGGAPPGAQLTVALYYRDAASNKVVIAQRIVTNSLATFPDKTNFVDFTARLAGVKPTDAWAGKYIGIQIVDTSGAPSLGYWDVDNVRVGLKRVPMSLNPARNGNQFQFTLNSEPGERLEILASTNITLALSNWTSLGVVTNTTGANQFIDTLGPSRRFYHVRQLP
jgi:hypothetical protein